MPDEDMYLEKIKLGRGARLRMVGGKASLERGCMERDPRT